MSDTITESRPKVALTFEVKLGLPDYSNVMARAWVEQEVTSPGVEDAALSVAYSLARAAVDEALADFGGIAKVIPQVSAQRTVRGKTEELSVQDLADRFGADVLDETEDYDRAAVAPLPKPQNGGGLRVVGKQHGDLPSWLFEAAAAAGVTKVFDNRDGLAENAKRPWFKDADGGRNGKAFWPPKGSKG